MKYLLIILIIILSLQSCSEKSEPVKPNPIDTCEGRRNLVPSITIYEGNHTAKKQFLVKDTVLNRNDVTFEAPEGFSSYTWKIGDDEREFNGRSVTFWFYEAWGELPIRLIVSNPIECFEYHQEYDTVYRIIHIKHYLNAKIIGEYFGINDDNPMDTLTVGIVFENDPTPTASYVVNIHRGCGHFPAHVYKQWLMIDKKVIIEANTRDAFDECMYPMGLGYLVETDEDSLIFDYAWGRFDLGDTIRQTFRGRRIK